MAIPEAKQYIIDFEQLGLGLFIHWGLYSQLGQGEWIWFSSEEEIKREDYVKLKDTFTAEDFDADELVRTAKEAGFRYITLTSRHHEGFSLYDTCGLNNFDAPHSGAQRDLIREFVDACNKYDVKPFFYHTTIDWWHKDFPFREHGTKETFPDYIEYLHKSVELLCKNYGKIGGFWFDGNWWDKNVDWKEDELYAMIRKYQPEAMIVNNTGMGERGKTGHPEIDSVTFENGQAEPMKRDGMEKYVAAEMCQTMNDHWGIGFGDINYKSPAELIKSLCNCRKVGANYLLNIGPEAQGKINPMQKELINSVGKWMDMFGEAIYNGRPYACKSIGDNFILKSVDGKFLYLFVYNLGSKGNENVIVGKNYTGAYAFDLMYDEVESIEWMDNGKPLNFIQGDGMLAVKFTGYEYGTSYVVRVAKAKIKN